jgi:protein TonB
MSLFVLTPNYYRSGVAKPRVLVRVATALGLSAAMHLALVDRVSLTGLPVEVSAESALQVRLVVPAPAAENPIDLLQPDSRLGPVESRDAINSADLDGDRIRHHASRSSRAERTAKPEQYPRAEIKPIESMPSAPSQLGSDALYYSVDEVDRRAISLSPINPRSPTTESSGDARGGRITLRIKIDENGVVNEIVVIGADPPGVFDGLSIEAMKRTRFKPAEKDGKAVKSQMQFSLAFTGQ